MKNKEKIKEILRAVPIAGKDYPEYIEALAERLKDEKIIYSHIPSPWIRADRRLPEDGETVLVWFEYFRYGDYNCPFQMYGLSLTINGKWSGIVNDTTGWKDLKIIAWQPLPAPPSFDEVKI